MMAPAPFDVLNISLEKKNLIEASAGTGKTFSIGILVLRLLIEPSGDSQEILTLPQLLMVTYTRNAVAELETRIRLFVRQAHQYAMGEGKEVDETIVKLVDEAMKRDSGAKERVQESLKQALHQLDETNIMTIHSFCQRVLTDHAFDTGQIFDARALVGNDFHELQDKIMMEWWRDEIQTIDFELYEGLIQAGFSFGMYCSVVKEAMKGKKMKTSLEYTNEFEQNQQRLFLDYIHHEFDTRLLLIQNEVVAYLDQHAADIKKAYQGGKTFSYLPLEAFDDSLTLFQVLCGIWGVKKQFTKYFKEITTWMDDWKGIETARQEAYADYLEKLYLYAIQSFGQRMEEYKQKNSVLFFDDMINRLATAIQDKPQLTELMAEKYRAIFIDEFQDTDKKQYEIFSTLFSMRSIIFYIGDPKQSIYGFRSADIHTYFKAKQEGVDRHLQMNCNYRSSKKIIESLNEFFKPTDSFDTFYTKIHIQDQQKIDYTRVETPDKQVYNALVCNGALLPPFTYTEVDKKTDRALAATSYIIELLKNECVLDTGKDKPRKLCVSDICVLVRTNNEGISVKQALQRHNIPSITVDENKVLESAESTILLNVLEAIVRIDIKSINKILLTDLIRVYPEQLLKLDTAELTERFKSYQQLWINEKKGVYVVLVKFITDFGIRHTLLNEESENGDRMLSNLLQLTEILHTIEHRHAYTPVELIQWLQRAVNGQSHEGDEYEQRIESDEEAVKIVTIHKSKGLEYPIVVAPFLDLPSQYTQRNIINYRNEKDGAYYFALSRRVDDDVKKWYEEQTEQENRRLFYVALTRAKYACHLVHEINNTDSTLYHFLTAITAAKQGDISDVLVRKPIYDGSGFFYRTQQVQRDLVYRNPPTTKLKELYWRKMSYSSLTVEHKFGIHTDIAKIETEYDRFAFSYLKKGSRIGNMLHDVLEKIDFQNDAKWDRPIASIAGQISTLQEDEARAHLRQMLTHTVAADLQHSSGSFSLQQIPYKARLSELEFDFPVGTLPLEKLQELSPIQTPWRVKHTDDLQGMMNGFIDLMFEHNGKIYILDWKSNYLGSSLDAYQSASLEVAMSEHNYHLQYHIYLLALCKYLKTRLPAFDYESHVGGVYYLFLRGLRAGQTTGVYYHRPAASLIQQLLDAIELNVGI